MKENKLITTLIVGGAGWCRLFECKLRGTYSVADKGGTRIIGRGRGLEK